jgi:hypothetical protein
MSKAKFIVVIKHIRMCMQSTDQFHNDQLHHGHCNMVFQWQGLPLTRKHLNQCFLIVKLQSSLRKLYGHDHEFFNRYWYPVTQMTTNMFYVSLSLFRLHFFLRDFSNSKAMGATGGAVIAHSSGAHELYSVVSWTYQENFDDKI